MSEYQYYEFQAIDRPLSDGELREVRSYSSRAHITPATFVNHYEWGSFKGDTEEWMDTYYDAFLYFANWGTHELKLRLPARLLDPEVASDYCYSECASVRERNGKIILSFCADDEDGGSDWEDDQWHLSSLIPLRTELANGDQRALYLGWLLSVQQCEFDDDETEPPVPPGLGELSAAQSSLAEFLRIDIDLLDVAAQASPPLVVPELNQDDIHRWIAKLAATEKDSILTELVMKGDHTAVAEIRRRFLKEQLPPVVESPAVPRTAGELLKAAEACAMERQRQEAEERAAEKARRQREEEEAREKYLKLLAGREPELWSKIETLVATRQPNNYDMAVTLLIDLRDLETRTKAGKFRTTMAALRQTHCKKPSFLQRLNKAGL
jgi:hypothetical protein